MGVARSGSGGEPDNNTAEAGEVAGVRGIGGGW